MYPDASLVSEFYEALKGEFAKEGFLQSLAASSVAKILGVKKEMLK